jgi:hypothetical protein
MLQGGLERRRNVLIGAGMCGGFGAGLMVPSMEFGPHGVVVTVAAVALLRMLK